ncbi:hypothetical protein Esti_002574 [Eimeria stiedai]
MGQENVFPPADCVRNVCILAHVDHGKTSLSDRLLAVNGLISDASAGKVRYLDSREDEQARQITIKASVVSLLYRRREGPACPDTRGALRQQGAPQGPPEALHKPKPSGDKREAEEAPSAVEGGGSPTNAEEEHGAPGRPLKKGTGGPPADGGAGASSSYVINLIDCPGHVDFASEVSAAVRLCDGCLLLVDVVEGVCPQTSACLQQALKEGLVLLLVLTKADRLICTLQLTPAEAYARCQAIVEQVNALLHQQLCSEAMAAGIDAWGSTPSMEGAPREAPSAGLLGPLGDPSGDFVYFDGDAAKKLEFCPSKGNVLLASSLHGWCLSVPSFASKTLLRQLGLPAAAVPKLSRALWGDWYGRRRRSKRAPPGERGGGGPPFQDFEVRSTPFTAGQPRLVEQLVFEPIWQLYAAAAAGGLPSGGPPSSDRLEQLCKMVHALQLEGAEGVAADLKRLLSPLRQRKGGDKAQQAEELTAELVASIMMRWMPVGETLLDAIARRIPNPLTAARRRLRQLCPALDASVFEPLLQGGEAPSQGEGGPPQGSGEGGAPPEQEEPFLLLYVAKFLAADTQSLRLTGDSLQRGEALGGFVGLGRVFVGSVRRGARLFVCTEQAGRGGPPPSLSLGTPLEGAPTQGPFDVRKRPLCLQQSGCQQFIVKEVYLLFGQDMRPVGQAQAGSVVAVSLLPAGGGAPSSGVEGGPYANLGAPSDLLGDVAAWLQGLKGQAHLLPSQGPELSAAEREAARLHGTQGILQSLTLSNKPHCPPLVSSESKASSAIVRVAVEPRRLEDLQLFLQGMARLYLADPSIELSVLDSGELLLGCCGEVHLETSLKDLETLFARVPIRVSPPMVTIRETLAFPPEGEGGAPIPGAPTHSLSRRVAFPPWAPKGGPPCDDGLAGPWTGPPETATTAAAAAGGGESLAAEAEDPLTVWLRRHRSSSSIVFGGGFESPLILVLKAQRMPDAVTDWLTENGRELGSVIKSRAPSPRFLSQQGPLGGPPSSQRDAGAPDRHSLLLRCLSGLEAEFCRVWKETGQQGKEGGSPCGPKGKGGPPPGGGPPGRLWGLALSGGACCALVASHSLTVLYPAGVPGSPSRAQGDPDGGPPSGWTFMAGARDAGLAAACSIPGKPLCKPELRCCVVVAPVAYAGSAAAGAAGPPSLGRVLPAVVSGFERGALNGPLAEEPIRGVIFELEVLVLGEALANCAKRVPQHATTATAATGGGDEAHAESSGGSPHPSRLLALQHVGPQAGQVGLAALHAFACICMHACMGGWGLVRLRVSLQVMSTVKDACRAAMLQRGLCRIYEAMLRFTLSCDSKVVGRAYGVLAKRRAKILREEMPEGQTSLFLVTGFLPTAEAVGISREIRSKASGHAALQLQFSHWEVLQEDPFPEASMTEEEVEDEGEVALAALATQITSRAIINSIRKSKVRKHRKPKKRMQ